MVDRLEKSGIRDTSKLSIEAQFLSYLIKLRLGDSFGRLGDDFGVSEKTACNNFHSVLYHHYSITMETNAMPGTWMTPDLTNEMKNKLYEEINSNVPCQCLLYSTLIYSVNFLRL